MKGSVLSSLTDASASISLPFILRMRKRIIGAINPNVKAISIVAILLKVSDSRLKAKIVKMIIVKAGGTKMVEIILANLCGLSEFNTYRNVDEKSLK